MKNILVLGGTGFVGAHVCEKLVQQRYHVTVPTRRRNNARNVMHLPGLTVLEADVHDEAALTRLVAGHDAVVNLVAILHGNAAAFDKVHVNLPQKLARACLANGVRRVVHISALGADDQHPESGPSEYLRSKGRGEAVLLHHANAANPTEGLDVTVLRPSVIFGAEDKFLNLFAKLQKVFWVMPLAGANARFQPVWVQDVAAAVVHSLKPRKAMPVSEPIQRVFELCGPDVFKLKQLVQLAARLSIGHERLVIPLPNWLGRIQAFMMELAPGDPLMSRDNLDSMKQDNVASGVWPGLSAMDIEASGLEPIAEQYLGRGREGLDVVGLRKEHR
jgi:NADH dehydrogenase